MPLLALGLMSGTSCDGVSAALGAFQSRRVTVLAERTFPYSKKLSRTLQHSLTLTTPELSRLHMELGSVFAQAARRLLRAANVPAKRLTVIGSHGQTAYHGPRDAVPSTFQIGAPAVIAQARAELGPEALVGAGTAIVGDLAASGVKDAVRIHEAE